MKKLHFLILLGLIIVGLGTLAITTKVQANAVCPFPGVDGFTPTILNRCSLSGYFTGKLGNPNGDVFNGGLSSIVKNGNAPDKQTFINFIEAKLNSSDNQDHLGAAFIIGVMDVGDGPGDGKNPSDAAVSRWESEINNKDVTLDVLEDQHVSMNSSYGTAGGGADEVFYEDSRSGEFLVFYSKGSPFIKIKVDCANLVNDAKPLPRNSPPNGNVRAACLNDGTGRGNVHLWFNDPDGNTSATLTIQFAGPDNQTYNFGPGAQDGADVIVSQDHAAGNWSAKLVVQDNGGNQDQTFTDQNNCNRDPTGSISVSCSWNDKWNDFEYDITGRFNDVNGDTVGILTGQGGLPAPDGSGVKFGKQVNDSDTPYTWKLGVGPDTDPTNKGTYDNPYMSISDGAWPIKLWVRDVGGGGTWTRVDTYNGNSKPCGHLDKPARFNADKCNYSITAHFLDVNGSDRSHARAYLVSDQYVRSNGTSPADDNPDLRLPGGTDIAGNPTGSVMHDNFTWTGDWPGNHSVYLRVLDVASGGTWLNRGNIDKPAAVCGSTLTGTIKDNTCHLLDGKVTGGTKRYMRYEVQRPLSNDPSTTYKTLAAAAGGYSKPSDDNGNFTIDPLDDFTDSRGDKIFGGWQPIKVIVWASANRTTNDGSYTQIGSKIISPCVKLQCHSNLSNASADLSTDVNFYVKLNASNVNDSDSAGLNDGGSRITYGFLPSDPTDGVAQTTNLLVTVQNPSGTAVQLKNSADGSAYGTGPTNTVVPYDYNGHTVHTSNDVQFRVNNVGKYSLFVRFNNQTDGFDWNIQPDSSCGTLTAGYRPYFSVRGGDVLAGTDFTSPASNCSGSTRVSAPDADVKSWNLDDDSTPNYSGAGSFLATLATGDISNFATSQTGTPTVPDALSFANKGDTTPYGGDYGGHFKTVPCTTDYYGTTDAGTTYNSNVISDFASLDNSGDNQEHIFSRNGNIKIDLAGNVLAAGERITLRVNGNVYIASDITYGAYDLQHIPRLNIYASGNIFVSKDVSELHGFYVAEPQPSPATESLSGLFATCYDSAHPLADFPTYLTTSPEVTHYDPCSQNQLKVYGAVAAETIHLDRTFGNLRNVAGGGGAPAAPARPAEIFQYTPELWLSGNVDCTTASTTCFNGKYSTITGLPPVL